MTYNVDKMNILNNCYYNFVKDKNISENDTDSLHIFIIDDGNKKQYFKTYLKKFLIKELIQFINVNKLVLIINILVGFLLFYYVYFDMEMNQYLFSFIFLTLNLPLYVLFYYVHKNVMYNGYYMKLKEESYFKEFGYEKKHIIKLMLHHFDENDNETLKFVFYHELHHFYESLNNLDYSEVNSDNYAKYMLETYNIK